MVGPLVSPRDRLCHQHVPMISPPDEDIVQQVPLTRPRMPPAGILSLRQAEECVRQDEAVFCAGAEKQQAAVVGAAETVGSQHSPPGSMVCADAGVEFAKDNQLVRLRHSRQEGVQVLVEFVFCGGVGAAHRRSVGADDGGEFAPTPDLERQTEAHQTIVDALRQTGQSSHDVVPDGEGDTRVTSLCPGSTTPEEGVVDTRLLQLAFFGESGLAECGDVHLVARQFSCH
nr:unnamed protein product [Spirometra erinaceieuropaei]